MSHGPVLPVLRRVGIIGDVHGEDAALEVALNFLRDAAGPLDAILCTGDVPAKQANGDEERCCWLLRSAGVITVRGNHDRWYFQPEAVRQMLGYKDTMLSMSSRAYLRLLVPTRRLQTSRGPLMLCHGLAEDDMNGIFPGWEDADAERELRRYIIPGTYRFMVAGHTHLRMVRPLSEMTVINAGTIIRDKEQPGFLTIDFDGGVVQSHLFLPGYAISAGRSAPLA